MYIGEYPQKLRILSYVSTSFVQLTDDKRHFTPNYPLNAGVGFAVKNTIFGAQAGYGFIPLKDNDKYGKSKMLDLQLHNYGRKMIFDVFFQNYKGFYNERKIGEVEDVFPDMSVMQIGGETTYIFNNERFSSKAAFDLSELQFRSAGSWLLGGGIYYFRVKGLKNNEDENTCNVENIQMGVNGGYGYSWVVNNRWMVSVMAKAGANFGNDPEEIGNGKVEVYPTAIARFSGNYHKNDWGVSMVIIIGNKSVYPLTKDKLNLTDVSMQLSYIKHLDHLFKRKNK